MRAFMYRWAGRFVFAIGVGAITATSARAQVLIPVSAHFHAEAVAGTITDTPADLDYTTETGPLSHGASASTGLIGAQASMSVYKHTAEGPFLSYRASVLASQGTGSAGAKGSMSFTFDITEPVTLREEIGLFYFGGINSFSITSLNHGTFATALVNGTRTVFFPADRYTVSFSAQGSYPSPQGSRGTVFTADYAVVPEPFAAALWYPALLLRRRSRT
jgi:hypothetical protein